MTNTQFPDDPKDGDIFKVNEDTVYRYSASLKCWRKLTGIDNISEATISEPGLMSSDDFIKIDNILIPSLDTTISGENCSNTFKEGLIKLKSSKEDIEIIEQLKLYNPDGTVDSNDFVIHSNTAGIDFRISIPRLIEELENRGSLRYLSVPGPRGDRGDRGDPGRDRIEAGPDGDKGLPGQNAPFPGSLIEDFNASLPTNKAVVDVRNDEDDPSKIIVTVGNIGNPGVGPKFVSWKQKNSPWMMGLSSLPFDCNQPPECVPTGNIFYIDISPILEKLKEKYEEVANKIKEEKEEIANKYVKSMSNIFTQQRQALCCALESVISRKVNQNIRNIWSDGRYQAAQAGYAFRVTDSATDLQPRNSPQQFASDFLPQNRVGEAEQNVIINGDLDQSPIQFDCSDCYVLITLNRTNIGKNRSVKIDLPAYDYVATLSDCCIYFDSAGGTGVFNVKYIGEDGPETINLHDRGMFSSVESKSKYVGDSISFRHFGGVAEFYLNPIPSLGVSGEIVICLQPASCFQSSVCINPNPAACDKDFFIFGRSPGKTTTHVLGAEANNPIIVYDMYTKRSKLSVYHPPIKDPSNLVASTGGYISGAGTLSFTYDNIEENTDQILVSVETLDNDAEFTYSVGCDGGFTDAGLEPLTAYISSAHAEFYERGWRTNNCCGALVDLDGQLFMVVFRSIGLDCNCGGAEYENTPFIKRFKEALAVQVALAWPTTDGDLFFGLPRNDDTFVELIYDKSLSDIIVNKIKSGDVIKTIGDTGRIAAVVVPSA